MQLQRAGIETRLSLPSPRFRRPAAPPPAALT